MDAIDTPDPTGGTVHSPLPLRPRSAVHPAMPPAPLVSASRDDASRRYDSEAGTGPHWGETSAPNQKWRQVANAGRYGTRLGWGTSAWHLEAGDWGGVRAPGEVAPVCGLELDPLSQLIDAIWDEMAFKQTTR